MRRQTILTPAGEAVYVAGLGLMAAAAVFIIVRLMAHAVVFVAQFLGIN